MIEIQQDHHCRRKIEMSPCAQSRDDTRWVTGYEGDLDRIPAVRLSAQFDCLAGPGFEVLLSATGEAVAGSAGEQPAEE